MAEEFPKTSTPAQDVNANPETPSEEVTSYDGSITAKKIAQRMIVTIISAIIGMISTYIATKFGFEIPDDIKTQIVVAIVIFVNSLEAGLKNWWKNRDGDGDGVVDKFENLYNKLTSIPVLKQFRFIWDICFTVKKK